MTDDPTTPSPDDEETGPTPPLTPRDPLGSREEPPPHAEPGPEPTPAPPPRRLTRSSGDRLVGGVAGGLGRYFGVDPILFRIGFVVLTLAGGVGALAYLGLLAFVPADDGSSAFGRRRDRTVFGAVLLGVVAVCLLGPGAFFAGPILLPLAFLVLIGILLWRAAGGAKGGGDPAQMAARGAIALLIGIAALGGFAAVFVAAALGGGTVLAALAVVAGVTLIASAFVGSARWLIAPA